MTAEDTIGLLDLLGIKRAHFIASSMGSCIALVLAAKYPERVKSLVLHVAFHRVPFPRNVIWGLMWKMPGGKKQMKKSAEFLFQQQYPPTLESFARQGLAPLNFDGRELLSQIKASTLIINGTKDQAVSMKITRELAQVIPGAKLALVEGDHLFITQDVNLLLKPALEFLAEVDALESNEK